MWYSTSIEGFNYKEFADEMFEQAKVLLSADIKGNNREYVLNTIYHFTKQYGEILYNDDNLDLKTDDAIFISQIIAEWSWHKSVDLTYSDIPKEYWDSIMQKIAYFVYETAICEIDKIKRIEKIEQAVNATWQECIENLCKNGIISKYVTGLLYEKKK